MAAAAGHVGPASSARFRYVAVVIAALLGLLIGRVSAAPPDRPERESRAAPTAKPTRQGAVVAALAYLDALRWDVLVDDERRRRAIERRATAEAAPQLDAELAAPAEALRAAVTRAPVVARTAVLGYRIERFAGERASVRVWGMALFGSGAYAPTTQWSTSELQLVWSAPRWLVTGIRSRGGPSPDSTIRTLARTTRALRELRHAP
jgi:hypothetical protein